MSYPGSTSHNERFGYYETAYVTYIKPDEFSLRPLIVDELKSMGLLVKLTPLPANPGPADIVVRIDFVDGWRTTKYVKSLNLEFIDAMTGDFVASGCYRSEALRETAFAVKEAFKRVHTRSCADLWTMT